MSVLFQPKLRFQKFSDEWKPKKIINISSLGSSKRVYVQDYVQSGVPFYRGKEISELKKGLIPKEILFISYESYKNYKNKYGVPKEGDILITAVGTIGNVLKIRNKSHFYFKDGNLIWIKNITENSDFLEALLEAKNKNIQNIAIGSSQKALTIVELGKLTLFFPTLKEQQKIASFLSSVDKKIELLTKKHEQLEKYKKGLMQKLFSQEIRFKQDDGSDFPDWEEKSLGEILDLIIDNRGRTPDLSLQGIPLIEVNAIGNIKVDYKKLSKFVDEDTFHNFFRKYLKEGDLLFSTVGEIAKCSIYDERIKSCIAQNIIGLRFNESIDDIFMFYCFTHIENKIKFIRITMGAVQPSIKVSQMIKIKFNVPIFQEQPKIASFLSSVDKKIDLIKQQIDKTQTFKKGLLQQMFV